MAVRALDGRNLDMYLSFLGAHLYAALLTHLRRFSGTRGFFWWSQPAESLLVWLAAHNWQLKGMLFESHSFHHNSMPCK